MEYATNNSLLFSFFFSFFLSIFTTKKLTPGNAKKRLAHYPQYSTSIATLDFSADGTMLAVSSSYTFEKGELEENTKDQLFVRSIVETDVRPRKSKRKRKGK